MNSTVINTQSWFIPLDIINIISLILVIILAGIFLFITTIDKTCHTVPMMLVINSCFGELSFASTLLWMNIITLHNDLEQIVYQDSPCIFRAYLIYVTSAAQFYSYLLQAIYRYITVIYPTRLVWQSKRAQGFLIGLSWLFAFIYGFPLIFTGEIRYIIEDQICQMPLHLSVVTVYNVTYVYLTPMTGIMLIYFKLIRYVKEMRKHVTSVNTLSRAQKELKMVHRIIILVSILLILGVPYAIFVFMGFISQPPKYHFRIAFTFIDVSLVFIMIALFQFTDPVKTFVMKKLNRRPTRVATTVT